jgi:multiple antibiotic resistance protein
MDTLPSLFLLGFSSLLPLINPVGTALIVNNFFSGLSLSERRGFSLSIVLTCLGLGMSTLIFGSWCLKFMGISIPTTQLAGGLVIARMGLGMLSSDGASHGPALTHDVRSELFYPLAFPLTLGPGSIAVLLTLSAHAHGPNMEQTSVNLAVLAASLVAVLIVTFFCLAYSGAVLSRIGPTGNQVLSRLMAFVVFCIGIQMVVTGLARSFPELFHG